MTDYADLKALHQSLKQHYKAAGGGPEVTAASQAILEAMGALKGHEGKTVEQAMEKVEEVVDNLFQSLADKVKVPALEMSEI